MKYIIIISLVLWFPTVILNYSDDASFFFWRHHLTILTGLIGFACMTISVVLALRLKWVEDKLNGLDKGYSLHKQMGIGALVFLVLHWVIIESAKWLISAGLLERPHRGGGARHAIEGINWTHLAKIVGEYTFYVFVIFAAISLIQLISYKKFKFTHNLAGAIFIAGAFHSVIIMDLNWPSVALDTTIILMSIVGVIGSVISLTGKIGRNNKVQGVISSHQIIQVAPSQPKVLHIKIKLEKEITYREGQFAYIDFLDGESPHPFSVLNYDKPTHTIEFAIKELGDYTTSLMNTINDRMCVTVEGGYGRFSIPQQRKQIWVGAGIGIVPFIAWLHGLSKITSASSKNSIDFYYCRRSQKESYFLQQIIELTAKSPNIRLHVITEEDGERLLANQIASNTTICNDTAVSFCGPIKFAEQLARDLTSMGLPEGQFYSEKFIMR
ncbi:ferric reductase-like transmembrane domain-containing protein [Vibrio sp.]|nr:ferric reductase-like transmembrane domain-containing protein [Vibrio sp.]